MDNVVDLDPDGTLAALESTLLDRRSTEVDDLELLAHWAVLHGDHDIHGDHGDRDRRGDERRGGDRLVRVGGAGTPRVWQLAIAEAATARRVAPGTCQRTLADVLDLQHRLPRTWAKVAGLEAEVWVARQVAARTRALTHEQAALVDAAVAAAICGQAPTRVLTICEAKVIEADPEAHAAKVEEQRRARYVRLGRTDEYGLRYVISRVEAGDAVWVDAILDRVADILATRYTTGPHGCPSRDELRAEAFGWLARPAELLQLLLEHQDTDTENTADATDATDGEAADAPEYQPTDVAADNPDTDHPDTETPGTETASTGGAGTRTGETEPGATAGAATEAAGTRAADSENEASDSPGTTGSGAAAADAGSGDTEAADTNPTIHASGVARSAADGATGPDRQNSPEAGHWGEPQPDPSPEDRVDEPDEPDDAGVPSRAFAFPADLLQALANAKNGALRPDGCLYVHLTPDSPLARVEGIGPVLADTALAWLFATTNVRVQPVIDLADRISVNAYEHPTRLKEHIQLREVGDYFPYAAGLNRRVDFDHPTPYHPTGPPGQTGTHNSGPLSRRHHRIKTHLPGWSSRQSGAGRYIWRTPHGRYYVIDHTGTRQIPADQGRIIHDAPPGLDVYTDPRIEWELGA